MTRIPGAAGRLLRIRRMRASEWWLLGEAWVWSLLVGCGLRWVPFERLVCWLDRPVAAGRRSLPPDVTPRLAARLVCSAAARAGRSTCLIRALVLKRFLLRRGVGTELVIGTKRGTGAFQAHAWLRLGDEILLGGEGHDEYAPLWTRSATPVGASP